MRVGFVGYFVWIDYWMFSGNFRLFCEINL